MEQFLHGIEVVEIDNGSRPIATVRSSVIGIVGTAPDADAQAFPLNTPVLVAGSRKEAARLDQTGQNKGTLPSALDSIFDQAGAMVVVVRVEEGSTAQKVLSNVLGGVSHETGQYKGVQALLAAESIVGVTPRILLAPGFTHTRVEGGVIDLSGAAGSGYTDGIYPLQMKSRAEQSPADSTTHSGWWSKDKDAAFTQEEGLPGSGFVGQVEVRQGSVYRLSIIEPGSGYQVAPELAFPSEMGTGSGATVIAKIGLARNAVVSELIGIAERLRAVVIADGPNTNDQEAIAYAKDFDSKRVFVVDPQVLKTNHLGQLSSQYSSSCVAGLLAKSDAERGWWWSPSNQPINGIQGTVRAVDFKLGDTNCRANLLNEKKMATLIRQDGFRLWGNRTLASDAKWAFLCVVRTADMIADSLSAAHLWAVDRGITKNYVTDIIEGVNAYLRHLTSKGAILGGSCWADEELNQPSQIAQGKIYFDFDFTPVYPAEQVSFRSHLVNDYIKTIFA